MSIQVPIEERQAFVEIRRPLSEFELKGRALLKLCRTIAADFPKEITRNLKDIEEQNTALHTDPHFVSTP